MKTLSKLMVVLCVALLALAACAPAVTPVPPTPTPEALSLPDGMESELVEELKRISHIKSVEIVKGEFSISVT